MAENSSIEWTDTTWNPVTGCTKISAGCDNCYAARFSERFRGVPGHPFKTGFDLTLRPERLLQPLAWKRSRMIFVNSMSDLFHKDIPRAHVAAVFDAMEKADWHIYQVLTKRSSLLQKFVNDRYRDSAAPAHMWFGVSVEHEQATSRIVHLQKASAAVRQALSRQHSLGDCRRREWPWRATDETGMGDRYSQPVRRRARAVLLQTMGWTLPQDRRPQT